jgi:hypothetical protein
VNHLVGEDALEAPEIAGERQDEAVARRLRHTADTFTQIAGDVVLAEIGAGREENDRLLLAELVPEDS